MNSGRRKRNIIVVASVLLVALVVIGVYYVAPNFSANNEPSETYETNNDSMEGYIKIIKDAYDAEVYLENKGMSETPYIELYKSMKMSMQAGNSEKEAINVAEEAYIKNHTFPYYAQSHNILIKDEDIDDYINIQIEEGKKTSDYEEVKAVCKAHGMSFEDMYWMNRDAYRTMYIRTTLLEQERKKFLDNNSNLIENKQTLCEEAVDKFAADCIAEYKKSDEYSKAKPLLKNSIKLLKNGAALDAEQLIKEKIFFD